MNVREAPQPNAPNQQEILDGLAQDWSPIAIRDLATTLLRLADSIDQQWDGSNLASNGRRGIFRWSNSLARIEQNALNLAMKARLVYDHRRKRKEFIPSQFLGEPAWDMLLELFMQFSGGAKVSITSLCIASDTPSTTALRYVTQLEEAGLVKKSESEFDKRVTFVALTNEGVLAVGAYLEKY